MSAVAETPRLRLRELTPDDAPFYLELINDPDWIANIGDKGIRSVEGARESITNGAVAMMQRQGFSLNLMELKETRQPIGICGLIKRDTLPDVDIGFALLPAWRGQGFTLEAAEAVMAQGKRQFGLKRIVGIVRPANTASIALLKKLGMQFEKMTKAPDGVDLCLYAWNESA